MILDLTREVKVIRPEAKSVFPYSNSLFIDDEVRVMVDAGAGGRAYEEIDPKSIDLLLVTHNHFDHVNGISFFTNAQIKVSEEEALGYRSPEAYSAWAGFRHWEKLMGRTKVERFYQTVTMPDDVPVKPGFQDVKVSGVLKDRDVFDLGKTRIYALHTPGHSHGHYAFYLEKEGILFSGDLDLSPQGPWYAGEYSNFDDLVQSVERIIEIDPHILVTSHRRVFDRRKDDIVKLLKDFIGIALEKEEKIYNLLTQPRTIQDIAQHNIMGDISTKSAYAQFWDKMMIMKHLERLEKHKRITRIDEDYYVQT